MASAIGVRLLLTLLPLVRLVDASFDLDGSDHNALLALQKQLTSNSQSRPIAERQSPCNPGNGVICEFLLDRGDVYVLRVTRIVLETRRLGGVLSPVVGRLSELKQLSLPNNSLVDRIPSGIVNCRKLITLNLRNNRFSGPVPSQLSALTSLRELDLSSNKLSGDLGFLAYLPNLEKLFLSNNTFAGRPPASLQAFSRLRSLDVSSNKFFDRPIPVNDAVRVLAQSLTENQNSAGVTGRLQKVKKTKKKNVTVRIYGFLAGTLAGGVIVLVLFPMIVRMKILARKHASSEIQLTVNWRRDGIPDFGFLQKGDALETFEVIGRGSSGAVYRYMSVENENRQFAIKTVPIGNEQDSLRIQQEFQTFQMMRHRNILPPLALVSASKTKSSYFMVSEFMENGSLEDTLRQVRSGTKELDWAARYKIAAGVAKGLEYLHTSLVPRVIHRDIKPGNILLDEEMEAKIADFGIALALPEDEGDVSVDCIQGTAGYMAPECGTCLRLTDKCDMFSFGVVLGVLVTGKFPYEFSPEMGSLVGWMASVMTDPDSDAAGAIDPQLMGNGCEEQMLFVLKIGYLCTLENPQSRPNITDVIYMLSRLQGDIV